MALGDRAKETTTSTGTGTLNLDGSTTGYQTLVAALIAHEGGSGPWSNVSYGIYQLDVDGLPTAVERGLGTVTDSSPDTLARNTVTYSTNSNALVNFGSGTKTVIIAPLPDDFSTVQAVELYLNADESIAAGDSEELINLSVKTGGDPNLLWAANQATAPYDALCTLSMVFSVNTGNGCAMMGTYAINDTLQVDWSVKTAALSDNGSAGGYMYQFRVDSGDTVQAYAHNTNNASAVSLHGDAAGDETQISITFTRI